MIQIHRKKLQENHTALVDTLDFLRTHILDHLYSDGLLSAADIEEIEVRISNFFLAKFLKDILYKKHTFYGPHLAAPSVDLSKFHVPYLLKNNPFEQYFNEC